MPQGEVVVSWEVYWDGSQWLAKRSNKGSSLKLAMGLAKKLNAAKGRLSAEAAALAWGWRGQAYA